MNGSAELLGWSLSIVERDWRFTRCWLAAWPGADEVAAKPPKGPTACELS